MSAARRLLPWRASATRSAIAALKMAALGHVLLQHVASPGLPFGPSMLPNFEVSQECILVSHLHRHGRRGVKVGDVVVYAIPTDARNNGVKRVLGLEGDYVLVETPAAAGARVDGQAEGAGMGGSQSMIQVPKGHCWLVGDNLPASRDSRDFGPLPMALITGKVVARLWPLWEPRWLRNSFDGQGEG